MDHHDYSIPNTIFFIVYLVGGIFSTVMYLFGSPSPELGIFRPKSDYLVYLIECYGLLFIGYVPKLFSKYFHISIPNYFLVVLNLFIIGCLLLGGMLNFYTLFPIWDSFLHFMSGIVLVILSMVILSQHKPKLSIGFMVFVAVTFAITSGVVWEILEYVLDEVTGSNSQSYKDLDGAIRVGHSALRDSMEDLILELVAAIGTAIYYIRKK
ncbi:membrane protein [Lachnospiraceae bacterium KM106-2]|nr:membrane protein [Lachnospiraceae bacterium KM106-2]